MYNSILCHIIKLPHICLYPDDSARQLFFFCTTFHILREIFLFVKVDRYGEMPVYVEESDLELLHTPSMNESTVYTNGYSYPGGDVIHDGDVLHLIVEDFRVMHTPGHTQGGVCYYVEKEGVLFSGDTLFCCSVGRSDFATSSTSALIRSIKEKLFLLPDETKVFPGHMGATTIGNEKVNNPYV